MNNKMKHMLFLCALFTALFSACSDDTNDIVPANPGEGINFSAGSKETRTIYDDENIFQINWKNNDLIKIFSNKNYGATSANGVFASDYNVQTANKLDAKTASLLAADANSQLKWADNTEHKFIAVYPNTVTTDKVEWGNYKNGVEYGRVTLPIHRNQVVQGTVILKDNTENGSFYEAYDPYYKKYKEAGYTYYCKPDMRNAYMVAYQEIAPGVAGKDVYLDFKPIMTTLEVVVKGKQNTKEPVVLTGISISRHVEALPGQSTNSFRWDAMNNCLGYETFAPQPTTKAVDNTKTENTFVSLPADKEIILNSGESVVFTVFLPPFDVNASSPISVRAHATGATEIVSNIIEGPIKAGNKRRITMKKFPESSSVNNWMTRLDDDIFVSQLSIPGTHDAGTGGGLDYHIEGGQTQYLTLQEQLNMGIRAFDLRPSIISTGLHIYHGIYKTLYSWDAAIKTMTDYLANNPGEFVIVLFRHETEGANSANNVQTWKEYISRSLTRLKGANQTVDFKPDLTVGECRGRILFLSRDRYTAADKPITGAYLGWSHSINGAEMDIWGPESPIGKINIQDCFNMSEAGCSVHWDPNDTKTEFKTKKWNTVSAQLDKSAKFHTDPNMVNRWSINHTSGYTAWKLPATNDYRENAAHQNPEFYKKVLDPAWEGSTGIIIADWVGTDISPSTWGTREYNVMGARMPQVIIDNNFKYRMKRKGEQ